MACRGLSSSAQSAFLDIDQAEAHISDFMLRCIMYIQTTQDSYILIFAVPVLWSAAYSKFVPEPRPNRDILSSTNYCWSTEMIFWLLKSPSYRICASHHCRGCASLAAMFPVYDLIYQSQHADKYRRTLTISPRVGSITAA